VRASEGVSAVRSISTATAVVGYADITDALRAGRLRHAAAANCCNISMHRFAFSAAVFTPPA
jgi:hypothetical protein